MGCNCSREQKTVLSTYFNKNDFMFNIKIYLPESDIVKIQMYQGKNDYILLSELLNNIFFVSDEASQLDANFMTVYDEENDQFIYFIQRMVGYQIENEECPSKGKMWIAYINKEKQDWSFLCANSRIVKKSDEIEFFYEKIE